MIVIKRQVGLLIGALAVIGLTSCSDNNKGIVVPETRHIAFERPAPVPPGAARMCWEEPMVQFEPNGPGLDPEGRWYRPSHIAVRKVKHGRWRPCAPLPSEVKGETNNER